VKIERERKSPFSAQASRSTISGGSSMYLTPTAIKKKIFYYTADVHLTMRYNAHLSSITAETSRHGVTPKLKISSSNAIELLFFFLFTRKKRKKKTY
jgi:hypothetical protein